MNKPSSDQELSVKLEPRLATDGLPGIGTVVIRVVRGENELLIEEELDSRQSAHDIDQEFAAIIDRAVLKEVLPVGIKSQLVQEFRESYYFIFKA